MIAGAVLSDPVRESARELLAAAHVAKGERRKRKSAN
jgi:hypothetical protein